MCFFLLRCDPKKERGYCSIVYYKYAEHSPSFEKIYIYFTCVCMQQYDDVSSMFLGKMHPSYEYKAAAQSRVGLLIQQ